MTDADLDRSYTALCHALGAVGPERCELMLSMVCLALMARADDADAVLPVIARARDRCLQEAPDGRA
ncbi:MAG TPA: hypothetical protein VIL30_02230 [Ramlibacter sp.]|jgi:hypothetical protein